MNFYVPGTNVFVEIYLRYFYTFRNGLFFAFPCIYAGMILFKNDRIKTVSNRILFYATAIIVVLYICECFFLRYPAQLTLMLLPISMIIILWVSRQDRMHFSKKLRCYSTLIYVIHHGIYTIQVHIKNTTSISINSLSVFMITSIISLTISMLIMYASKRFKAISILY